MSLLNRVLVRCKNRIRYSPFLRGMATRVMADPAFPGVIGVDPTNRCNLNCSFCGPKTMGGEKGAMPLELFEKLVSESKAHGKLWMLILHNFGEPLMNRDIARMVALAKESGIARSVQFSTNGTLLTEVLARELIEARLDGIVFSVDAATPEEYTALKGADLLPKVVSNARMLLQIRKALKSKRPFVSAKMVQRPGFESSYGPFLRQWRLLADEAVLTPFSNWGNRVESHGKPELPLKRYACHFPFYYPAINWDGRVFFCCAACDDDAVVGDLKTSTLAEIWKGEGMARVRRAHLQGEFDKIKSCAKCTYWAESKTDLDRFLGRRFS